MTTITPQLLLKAYSVGVFPMAESANDPALYWIEPEERGLIPLDKFHISHSLRKAVRRQKFEIRIDTAFEEVIKACAALTKDRDETWINARILRLYTQLHKMGCCHSVECWQDGALVGGLYGLRLGGAFFGESMFSRATDASKVALVHLVARLKAGKFKLLDAQFLNPHLEQFGCYTVKKAEYRGMLDEAQDCEADFFAFTGDGDAETVLRLAQSGGG
ncbi:MAG: leucyl/phenylalanyl-tRNA--protein transferase [Alphaproteobacteria bacterium]|nr:leucyl/phenylalanyl-tRNA--protein transferase [Alphaproteobacteria bacterium]